MLKGLAVDHFYKVRAGAATAIPWPLKTFKLHLAPEKFRGPPVAAFAR